MPGIDGVETARRIRALTDSVRILMLTTFEDDALVLYAAVRAGADGFLLGKTVGPYVPRRCCP